MQNAKCDARREQMRCECVCECECNEQKTTDRRLGIPYWLDAGPERIESAKLRNCVGWGRGRGGGGVSVGGDSNNK